MECWSLPEEVCRGVRYFNDPLHEEADAFSQVVYIANRALRQHQNADGPIESINDDVLLAAGLTQQIVDEEIARMNEHDDELQELTRTLSQ
jgi:hypothetical protein